MCKRGIMLVTVSFNQSESCIHAGPHPEYKILEKVIEILALYT